MYDRSPPRRPTVSNNNSLKSGPEGVSCHTDTDVNGLDILTGWNTRLGFHVRSQLYPLLRVVDYLWYTGLRYLDTPLQSPVDGPV